MKKILQHPVTQKTRRALQIAVAVAAVLLAVAFVTTVTIDLGPSLKARAEAEASKFMRRPLRIGSLSVQLWRGRFLAENVVIEGFTPGSRPFLTARRISASMPWSTLFSRRVVFDAIEMVDWNMYVETFPNGRHNVPKFTRDGPRRRSAWTTTLQYVRAHRGEVEYRDHGTPWNTIARNLEVTIARPSEEYRGTLRFSNGTVAIQSYVPFRSDLYATFKIDGSNLVFDKMDLATEGSTSEITGVVDMSRWPEQTYQIRSKVQLAPMRPIFFARDRFTLSGESEFRGTFHMFRGGRELKGEFYSPVAGINDYRFADLRGSVLWVPDRLEVRDATTAVYGGTGRFDYTMQPLGKPGVPTVHTLDGEYDGVNLTTFTTFLRTEGIRLAGTASGRNVLQWPSGRWAERRGDGEVVLEPPAGVSLMTRTIPVDAIDAEEAKGEEWGPFSNHTPMEPVPIGARLTYSYGPGGITLAPSRIATRATYVEVEGHTAWFEESRLAFHVTSGDWQESDRVFAGVLTAFNSPTRAIEVGGFGTFDGVMTKTFRRPRIEGTFAGERLKAWDVVWGRATGSAVIENSYADVTNVVVTSGASTIHTEGRYSLGYPRRDRGEEIDARVRIINRPLRDLRHAFMLDDYPVDGLFSGEYHVYGFYETPLGFGRMSIVDGVAYGEPFETATAMLRFEGAGVRLDDIQMVKGGGRGTGAAYVGWAGTYSFNFEGRRIPIESVALMQNPQAPLSGRLDFTAGGSGTFDVPRYDVRATIRDFFVADEGIGQVLGEMSINGDLLTMTVEAASPRLAISGTGRIALTPEMDAEMTFNVSDTSLDPYVRAFEPRVSPFTTAVASGTVRVVGELANIDHLLVDATVDRLDMRLFDYRVRNAVPIRIALDRHSIRLAEMRLVGEDTQLDVSGTVSLHDERIAVRTSGTANLGILQGFVGDIRSSGRARLEATLEGAMRDPIVNGTFTVDNGRIRHFQLPHALEHITGAVRFDTRGIRLDELRARLGGGDVQFGGRIDIDGYRLGRLDVTVNGEGMRLRFPEGMRSLVDADLTLTGTSEAPLLGGTVQVRSAIYTRRFDAGGGMLELAGGAASSSSSSLPATLPLRYDVRITAPSTLRIENNTARIVASADLQLRGTFDRPLLFGRAEIERGEVRFEGKRYAVTRGTIDFNNPARIEPFFDLETETRVRVPGQTYRITVRAAGTFERLAPEFTADPPLPEVEVLALLFSDVAPGGDVELRQYSTSVTPQQQLLRERATRALTGVFSAQVGRVVEQTFGVDTFQLTPSLVDPYAQSSRLNPAARLTIGKRLSERTYLTYSRSLSSTTRDQIILLEYDQSERFSWILSQNEDRTYALDVRVRHVF